MSEKIKKDPFICGVACSVAFLIKGHGEDSMAKDMMFSLGFSFEDFVNAGVDKYDLDVIKKIK